MSDVKWKLVPVEPTEAMMDAAIVAVEKPCFPQDIYAAMLAAAPASPPEALPSQTSGAEAGIDWNIIARRMQRAGAPGTEEELEAALSAALAKPASEPAGGGVREAASELLSHLELYDFTERDPSGELNEFMAALKAALSSPASPTEAEALQAGVESLALVDLQKVVDAWEALPGGRYYNKRVVQEWLIDDMKPAIDAARETLGDTDALFSLVARFSAALLAKLRAAEKKYGYSDAWMRADWQAELVKHMQEHVAKGDPRDVAAYCAFAWHHGWPVSPASLSSAPAQEDGSKDLGAHPRGSGPGRVDEVQSVDLIGLRARCEARRKLGVSDAETEGDGEEMANLVVPLLMLERVLDALSRGGAA